MNGALWKYCTLDHCRDMLLSFHLLNPADRPDEKVIACLYSVGNHVESHYHPAAILKRDGTKRHLLVPDPLLKMIQKNILHHILDTMPVSDYAYAYRKGGSILGNATAHTQKEQILKLDIENFFGSILFPSVMRNAFPGTLYPPPVATLLTYLCCYEEYLPQGAPTSAAISNLVMRPFDEYMGRWCGERGISYTRYCDDMTFSGSFDARGLKRKVSSFLGAMGFSLKESKTRLLSAGACQTVTGIVVNQKPQVPSSYRRKLRQEVYYCQKFGLESHLVHSRRSRYLEQGTVGQKQYLQSLLGKINFVLFVNPGDAYFAKARSEMRRLYSTLV